MGEASAHSTVAGGLMIELSEFAGPYLPKGSLEHGVRGLEKLSVSFIGSRRNDMSLQAYSYALLFKNVTNIYVF